MQCSKGRSSSPSRMASVLCLVWSLLVVASMAHAHDGTIVEVPKLSAPVLIDGDLSDLSPQAWSSGLWDLDRMKKQAWFVDNPWPMEMFDSGKEPSGTANTPNDITGEYFMAWDDNGLYLAVRATDNVHDVTAGDDIPWGWYMKDGCSWFIDVRHDGDGWMTSYGDHVFSFIAEDTDEVNNTWWRHGDDAPPIVEKVNRGMGVGWRMNGSWMEEPGHWMWESVVVIDKSNGTDYVIEAFVPFGEYWMETPQPGDTVGLMIVHSDADGGKKPFGGQIQLFGAGDHDGTWADMVFTD